MNIWAFNSPEDEAVAFVSNSVTKGKSRFGWSYIDTADLNVLEKKGWDDLTKEEADCYSSCYFMLNIEKGDWIVHINVPEYGHCTAVQVSGGYSFDKKNNKFGSEYTDKGDYRHCIDVDPNTVVVFDRNDPRVHPIISRKLKLRGKYWHIYDTDEFISSIKRLRSKKKVTLLSETHGQYHLKMDIENSFSEITKLIHRNHPGKNLENLVALIFKRIPNVQSVKVNGSGWGTDFGADVLVKYLSGIPAFNLQKEELLVVQVKSYEGDHYELSAVEQIKTAIKKFNADMGIIITTAQTTEEIEKAVEVASAALKKPISIISGSNVAKFLLRYASDLIIDTELEWI